MANVLLIKTGKGILMNKDDYLNKMSELLKDKGTEVPVKDLNNFLFQSHYKDHKLLRWTSYLHWLTPVNLAIEYVVKPTLINLISTLIKRIQNYRFCF